MSSNSKKLLGGVIGVLAIISVLNTNAIIGLTNEVRNQSQAQRVVYVSEPLQAQQEIYKTFDSGNQQAALASLKPTIVDDDNEGYIVYWLENMDGGRCALHADTYEGNPPVMTNSTITYGNQDGGGGCVTPTIAGGNIITAVVNGVLSISGGTPVTIMQYKLALVGFLPLENITGKNDLVTQAALKAFQTANKISATGTYGPLTKAALDSKIQGVK